MRSGSILTSTLRISFLHNLTFFIVLIFYEGHAHLTDFNIATIVRDGERATALAGTKPYMGE